MNAPTRRPSLGSRAGFTLLELLIALIVFAGVSAVIFAAVRLSQRTSRAQAERSALQGNLRAAIQVATAELKQLQVNTGAGTTDIVAMNDSAVTFRSMRASGVTCDVGSSSVVLRNVGNLLSTGRQIVPGRDSILLFVDSDTLRTADDQWLALPINSTPSSSTCPDGTIGVRLQTNGVPVANVWVPGPVRTFEVMQMASVRNGGKNWLGARSVSAGQTLQPFLGPIDSTTGVRFTYRDAVGSVVGAPASVRQIDIFVQAASRNPINEGVGEGPGRVGTDSLQVRVALRNSR